jgi:hypothetical protein
MKCQRGTCLGSGVCLAGKPPWCGAIIHNVSYPRTLRLAAPRAWGGKRSAAEYRGSVEEDAGFPRVRGGVRASCPLLARFCPRGRRSRMQRSRRPLSCHVSGFVAASRLVPRTGRWPVVCDGFVASTAGSSGGVGPPARSSHGGPHPPLLTRGIPAHGGRRPAARHLALTGSPADSFPASFCTVRCPRLACVSPGLAVH